VISFVTLFLGLLVGPQRVELAVGGEQAREVAAVELWLDGAKVEEIARPPWITAVDFGEELVPHDLVAVAVDEEGGELDRTRVVVNVPRPPVAARIALGDAPAAARESDTRAGPSPLPRSASVSWEAVDLPAPERWTVRLDDKELPVSDLSHFELPPVDPETIHFLTAQLDFGEGVTTRAEATFGGVFGLVSTELTAVALLQRSGPKLQGPDELAGWFRADGRDLAVVALDRHPPGSVVLVIDPLAGKVLHSLVAAILGGGSRVTLRRLGLDDRVTHLRPGPRRVVGEHQTFDAFQPVDYSLVGRRGDFTEALENMASVSARSSKAGSRRLADAVAVAGMLAAESRRARAVVLLVGAAGDDSLLSAEQARGYLEALGVPLFVWRVVTRKEAKEGLPLLAEWPGARLVSRRRDLVAGDDELRKSLDAQRIVWLDGTHLLRDLELSETARARVAWAR
jgi:hypothetical protein